MYTTIHRGQGQFNKLTSKVLPLGFRGIRHWYVAGYKIQIGQMSFEMQHEAKKQLRGAGNDLIFSRDP